MITQECNVFTIVNDIPVFIDENGGTWKYLCCTTGCMFRWRALKRLENFVCPECGGDLECCDHVKEYHED
jgi:transcription initiation factor IIE alpha subunit